MIFNNSKFNSHWPSKTLNELGTFNRGKSKHRPRNDIKLFKNGNIPLIQTGDVKQANIFINTHSNNYNEFGLAQSKLWPKGTLCITIAANIAETSMLGYDMCFPDSVVGFNAFPDKCSEIFMHYIFTYIRAGIQSRIQGSIQDNINIEYLTNLKFKIPKKEERYRIENLLYSLDAKIEINNKINQELETIAKTLYDYWFVQFDFPDKNKKPYKSSGGKMVFNEALKREIPEGWEVKTIGDYCKSTGGYAFKSSMWSDNGVQVIKIKDIQEDCTINLSDVSYADIKDKVIDEKFISKAGDVLIAMTGATVGKYAIVPLTDKPLYVNQRVGYFDLGNNPTKRLPFLINSLNQKYFRDVVFKVATGAAQPNISNEQINNIKLVTPNKEILEIYNNRLKTTYDRILNNQKQNQKLSELRDWLLPMLMNGQVTVGGLEEESLGLVAEEEIKYGNG